MDTTLLRQKLHDYINMAQEKKLEAIYTILESEIEASNWWEDKEFVAELDKREEEYMSDSVEVLTIERSIEQAKLSRKKTATVK